MITRLFIALFIVLGIQAHGCVPPATIIAYDNVHHELSTDNTISVASAAFVPSYHGSESRTVPGEQEPGTQLQQRTDVAIHVSLVSEVNSGFLLLADLHGLTHWRVREPVNPIAFRSIFNVLFRVIISPNAP
ncbi:MAG TPA: hypothetical protein VG737_10880 [Cyclobacteriaceae bacterium]|nr:hypothetical protein [Cyclobacteriaceae bacterium]